METVSMSPVACRAQLVAEAGDELCQRVQLVGVGQVVYAVGEHLCFLALGHLAYGLGHGAVGQQHEFLHQLVGVLRFLEVDAQGLAFLVNLELHLHAVELQRTARHTPFAQLLRQAVQLQQFIFIVAFARLDDLLRFLVGEAAVALDDGVDNAVLQHFGLVVHLEDDAIRQLLLVRAEGAEQVAEPFG